MDNFERDNDKCGTPFALDRQQQTLQFRRDEAYCFCLDCNFCDVDNSRRGKNARIKRIRMTLIGMTAIITLFASINKLVATDYHVTNFSTITLVLTAVLALCILSMLVLNRLISTGLICCNFTDVSIILVFGRLQTFRSVIFIKSFLYFFKPFLIWFAKDPLHYWITILFQIACVLQILLLGNLTFSKRIYLLRSVSFHHNGSILFGSDSRFDNNSNNSKFNLKQYNQNFYVCWNRIERWKLFQLSYIISFTIAKLVSIFILVQTVYLCLNIDNNVFVATSNQTQFDIDCLWLVLTLSQLIWFVPSLWYHCECVIFTKQIVHQYHSQFIQKFDQMPAKYNINYNSQQNSSNAYYSNNATSSATPMNDDINNNIITNNSNNQLSCGKKGNLRTNINVTRVNVNVNINVNIGTTTATNINNNEIDNIMDDINYNIAMTPSNATRDTHTAAMDFVDIECGRDMDGILTQKEAMLDDSLSNLTESNNDVSSIINVEYLQWIVLVCAINSMLFLIYFITCEMSDNSYLQVYEAKHRQVVRNLVKVNAILPGVECVGILLGIIAIQWRRSRSKRRRQR